MSIALSFCTRLACAALSAALLLSLTPSVPCAQVLDSPTLSVTRVGFFRIDLEVRAGASGAPNGFAVQWMKRADYDAYGWPAGAYDPLAATCDFSGDPTLNPDARSGSFQLGPDGVIGIQMGDLFDETGVDGPYLDQLEPGEYVFRVWAEGSVAAPSTASAPSAELFATTAIPECTQGFWKTHPEVWPVGCTPMTIGTVSYTKTELLSIFNTPAAGNGLLSLAHQLIATKLNICNGSNAVPIQASIDAADALIGGLVIPPVGAGSLAPASTSALTGALDDYNNGITPGVVACATPARRSSWGAVKSIYR